MRPVFYPLAAIIVAVSTTAGCGSNTVSVPGEPSGPTSYRLTTTRLCALVPARDPALGVFPQPTPIRPFGTDLGWTYERDGLITIVFGDTMQRLDVCPLQVNDDSLATFPIPPDTWPGYTASTSIADAECPELDFVLNDAGTAFGPIELRRWDGVPVPLGYLHTPVTAFHDGQREWAIFIVDGGQSCSEADAASGAPCPTDLSAQAGDLVCGTVGRQHRCVDPTSTKTGSAAQAYYLHIGERVGPVSYISRAMFLTNKYLNLTARAVRAFDPDDPRRNDYRVGGGALLVWGRPGFEDQDRSGEAPPYFLYHPLPFEVSGERIVFQPRYLRDTPAGGAVFRTNQADATPLYRGEFDPVNHMAVSWVEPLEQWVMIYGGSVTDVSDPNDIAGLNQPVRGALHARFAPDPWGPWSDPPQPILTNDHVAQDLVCGKQAPPGCLPTPDPPIRAACMEFIDPGSGGCLYGANIIDAMTRPARSATGRPAADIFWDVSNYHPYGVLLIKTRIEAE